MKKYIVALDEGTTSVRSILFDKDCKIVGVAQKEFKQIYPKPGWIEHDPMDIFANQIATLTECIAKSGVDVESIAAVGITNQRETTVVWEKATGKPIYNAIVWQCRRTADICEELEKRGLGDYIKDATGLRIDPYFSATKIKWILDNVEGARKKAENGELLFGTIDTWLTWKLTDGKTHVTDRTNASRTMLYNINNDDWDERILKELDIPKSMLPKIASSSEIYGYMDFMGGGIPIAGIAGDQQAALFGQCCFEAGEAKTTYGTGCFLLANTGSKIVKSKHGLLTTIAATVKDAPIEYVLEGSVFVCGAVIQWIRDELRFITDAGDSEYFATKVPDNGGVYIVPAFSGLGAPYWDAHARGSILGVTRGTNRSQIIRAGLESIAYQCEDLINAMESDFGEKITSMKVDGGGCSNNFTMQFQADISNLNVVRPAEKEATAMGVAFLAGLATGFFESMEELKQKNKAEREFSPEMDEDKRTKLLNKWHKAVKACQEFAKE
ncbi:MAG: glycerol kinase GlpK [Parasporobacterium sp.]|nr:glycerol kinase GlpK [Parasporobacterium sp.]